MFGAGVFGRLISLEVFAFQYSKNKQMQIFCYFTLTAWFLISA